MAISSDIAAGPGWARRTFGNPLLHERVFGARPSFGVPMTLGGVVNKTALLYLIVLVSTTMAWASLADARHRDAAWLVFGLGLVGAIAVAWKAHRSVRVVPSIAAVFAMLEGVALGAAAAAGDAGHTGQPGIFIQVLGLTFNTLFFMLLASKCGLLGHGVNFKTGVHCGLSAVGLQYFIDLAVLRSGEPVRFIHDASFFGIVIGAVVVAWTAANLILDFRSIEVAVNKGVPAQLEWRAAFALVLGLAWPYFQLTWTSFVFRPSRQPEPVRQAGAKPDREPRRRPLASALDEDPLWKLPAWLMTTLMTVFFLLGIGLLGLIFIGLVPWIFEKLNPYLS